MYVILFVFHALQASRRGKKVLQSSLDRRILCQLFHSEWITPCKLSEGKYNIIPVVMTQINIRHAPQWGGKRGDYTSWLRVWGTTKGGKGRAKTTKGIGRWCDAHKTWGLLSKCYQVFSRIIAVVVKANTVVTKITTQSTACSVYVGINPANH